MKHATTYGSTPRELDSSGASHAQLFQRKPAVENPLPSSARTYGFKGARVGVKSEGHPGRSAPWLVKEDDAAEREDAGGKYASLV